MKLSELIKQLQEIERKKGGDCQCHVNSIKHNDKTNQPELIAMPVDKLKSFLYTNIIMIK